MPAVCGMVLTGKVNTMDEQQALAYLQQLRAGGMTLGLERMERMMELCGNPHRRLRTVHIAGTNGKGSTARMIQAMGMAAGYRVGLFSSPAVTGVRDTMDVNGQAIPAADFARWIALLRDRQEKMGEPGKCSEFELLTAAAFGWLAEQNTDFCVVECGLGGKEDATNILPPPLVAVLTSISLDHTAVLGNTVEAIARQKCGIIKPPCSVVVSDGQSPQALGVIWETAARLGLTVHQPHRRAAIIRREDWGKLDFSYDGMEISLPLTGREQCINALTALEVVRLLGEKGYPISIDEIVAGLGKVRMPCRQEVICRHPLRVMDGAHNPQGIAALADTIGRLAPQRMTMLCGMLADKDVDRCLRLLASHVSFMVCTTPPNSRALPAEELAQRAVKAGIEAVAVSAPQKAWLEAEERAGENPLLVGGSFYLCAALRPIVLKLHQ